ncbi:hypothetical protein ACSFBF_08240 [Variovorax sp. ZT5P49]
MERHPPGPAIAGAKQLRRGLLRQASGDRLMEQVLAIAPAALG